MLVEYIPEEVWESKKSPCVLHILEKTKANASYALCNASKVYQSLGPMWHGYFLINDFAPFSHLPYYVSKMRKNGCTYEGSKMNDTEHKSILE